MAAELLAGAGLGAVFGELLSAVLKAGKKAVHFNNTLEYLRSILIRIDPLIKEMEKQNHELDLPKEELNSLIEEMKRGTNLVHKCSKVNMFNYYAKSRYEKELANLVECLESFFKFDVPAQTSRDTKETLFKVTRILSAIEKQQHHHSFAATNSSSSSGSDDSSVHLESDNNVSDDDENDKREEEAHDELVVETLAMPLLDDIATLVHKVSQGQVHSSGDEEFQNKQEKSDRLRSSIQYFGTKMGFKVSDDSDEIVSEGNNLIAQDISKLEDGFKLILSFFSKPVEPKSLFDWLRNSMGHEEDDPLSSHHESTPLNIIPSRIVSLLHYLAQLLLEAGHQQQLLNIYRDVRSNWLEESIKKFGVEKLNNDDAQKLQFEILEAKNGSWIHLMPIAVKLFDSEKKVCNLIFEGFDSVAEECFAEVTANNISMLLSIGEANAKIVVKSSRNFHSLLHIYETMLELHLEIETLFGGTACTGIREAIIGFTKRLAKMANEVVFGDFDEIIDSSAIVTDGVHPLTSYMINFVRVLYDCQSILKKFQEFEGGEYSSEIKQIMQELQSKLDLKSEQYRDDPAFKHLFLMNNIYYIVKFVQSFEAKEILGNDWVRVHVGIVQYHAKQYIRNGWAESLRCISEEGIYRRVFGMSTGVSRAILKDRLRTFNDMFEKLHQKQSEWRVPDPELRESLQLSVAVIVLPAYRSFVNRFGPLLESGKTLNRYIKYTPEDLEGMLAQFFQGDNVEQTNPIQPCSD
ncbi:hypothetical protein PIB30_036400 [Stylosanthes scabra]|uniref:Exocyst subunit Exo70 family protein n=1 Tax=Stylosanthes scabra TaxID=79078 RepID=A0ABU6QCV9_9FABA|nr:hypothetical protein [Stylosanthes scabra]